MSPAWVPGVRPTTVWMPSASSAALMPSTASAIAKVGASLPPTPPGLVESTLKSTLLDAAELLPVASSMTATIV
ncbi:hypothetical protein D3C72_2147600 [compost metagenome]